MDGLKAAPSGPNLVVPLRLSGSERSLTNPDTGSGRFVAKSAVYSEGIGTARAMSN